MNFSNISTENTGLIVSEPLSWEEDFSFFYSPKWQSNSKGNSTIKRKKNGKAYCTVEVGDGIAKNEHRAVTEINK